jgi:hypothetical protein
MVLISINPYNGTAWVLLERTHTSQAALTAEINSISKILADGVLKDSLMIKAASLYAQEWPSTKFLDKAHCQFQHFFVQHISGLRRCKNAFNNENACHCVCPG